MTGQFLHNRCWCIFPSQKGVSDRLGRHEGHIVEQEETLISLSFDQVYRIEIFSLAVAIFPVLTSMVILNKQI